MNELSNDNYWIQVKALDAVLRANMQNAIPLLLYTLKYEADSELSERIRQRTWAVLMQLRPEAKQIQYDPVASPPERQSVIAKLRALLAKVK